MMSNDPNTANAYVLYRTEQLATRQENIRPGTRKSGKAGLALWKRIFR